MLSLYDRLIDVGEFLQSYLLLAMRLYWGIMFFLAGYEKINNLEPVIQFFTSLNIPFPDYMALYVGWVETIGGICLMAGLIARVAAIPLAIIMITALLTAHGEAAFGVLQNPQRLINQLPFNYLLTTLVVFCFGPGKISIDHIVKRAFYKKNQ